MFKSNRKKLWIISLFALVTGWGCRFYFATTKDQVTVQKKVSSVERGRVLTYTICSGCHFDHKTSKFTGKSLNDLPKIGGRLNSANLTHATGNRRVDKYSDAELFYLLKTGISRSGKFMPYMMKPMMADEDVNDIIVFLRSDDAALAADETSAGKTKINLIGRIGIRFLMGPQPYNKNIPRPDEDNSIAYGRYLVGTIGCYHCHSRKTTGLDFLNPENTKGYLQGGIKLKDPGGNRIYAPNLTPDKETGIGNFTKQGFRDAVRKGITPAGEQLSPPMGKFDKLSDKQVDAIYDYLQALPPVKHKTPAPVHEVLAPLN